MSDRTDFETQAREWLDREVTCSPAQRAALAPRLATILHDAFVAGQEAEDASLRVSVDRLRAALTVFVDDFEEPDTRKMCDLNEAYERACKALGREAREL